MASILYPVGLPATEGQALSTGDGYKVWTYVSSKSEQKQDLPIADRHLVGRWVLSFDFGSPDSGGGSGGGTTGPKIEFSATTGVNVEDPGPQIIGSEEVRMVTHTLNFDNVPELESL